MAKQKRTLPPEIRALFEAWGAQGGKTTAKRRTAAERRAAAMKAIQARWQRYNEIRNKSKERR